MFSFLLTEIFWEGFWSPKNFVGNSASYNNDWCLQNTYLFIYLCIYYNQRQTAFTKLYNKEKGR